MSFWYRMRKIRAAVLRLNIILGRLVPYRGQYAYEVQIGALVCMFYHKQGRHVVRSNYQDSVGIGPLRFWQDKYWLFGRKTGEDLKWLLISILLVSDIVLAVAIMIRLGLI